MLSISALEISQWSETYTGRANFSELVSRLVRASATINSIRNFRFPTREAGVLPGMDGVLDCDSAIRNVPKGRSVWELGTDDNARNKIRGDWNKRLDEPNLPQGWKPGEVTYVAVVSRNISNHGSYREELMGDSRNSFKDLIIMDATDLEVWIANCPSVDAWLRDEHSLGGAIDLKCLTRVARAWMEVTDPVVAPELILAGREKNILSLVDHLQGISPGIISVFGDSPDEAISFIYAVLELKYKAEGQEAGFWKGLLDRAVVCRKLDVAQNLADLSEAHQLLVILHGDAISRAAPIERKGHIIIIVHNNQGFSRRDDIILSRPRWRDFARVLEEQMKFQVLQAEIDARACGGSSSVWRIWRFLKIASPTDELLPEWAQNSSRINIIVPAIFLGGWDESNQADLQIITRLSGLSFADFNDIQNISGYRTPLISRVDMVTTISGAATAFALIVGKGWISSRHLKELILVVESVFSEVDPMVELPPSERYMAGLLDKKLSHSSWLRNGLAETLLRIVVLGEKLEQNYIVPDGLTCQQFVDRLIRGLPGLSKDWRLMASLRDQLPVLMESAPYPFIEALETLLQGDDSDVAIMFQDGESWMGHSLRSGLLWGLEALAWEPDYLARVVLILARLHLHDPDPEGNMSNRPLNSLRDIFLAWYPGTSATVDQRMAALDALADQFSDIAWTLLCKLIPSSFQQTTIGTHAPLWRDFGRSQQQPLPHAATDAVHDGYLRRAIQQGRQFPDRLCFLVKRSEDMPNHYRIEVVNALDELEATNPASEIRKMVSSALRNLVGRHTQFNDAAWAMPGNALQPFRERLNRWTSKDCPSQFDWLFNEYLPNSPFPSTQNKKPSDAVKQLRSNAIDQLWQQGGWPVIYKLIQLVQYPGLAAEFVAGKLTRPEEGIEIIGVLAGDSLAGKIFASDFSSSMLKRFGNDWLKLLAYEKDCQAWSPAYWVSLCRYFPDSRLHIDWIASLGQEVDSAYWQEKLPYIHLDSDLVPEMVVNKYLSVGRSWRAITYISSRLDSFSGDRVIDVLQECLKSDPIHNVDRTKIDEVDKVVAWLRQQEDIDKFRLMNLEYNFLPWLAMPSMTGISSKPLTLHRGLAEIPNLFVQIICDVFRASSVSEDEEELTPEKSQRSKLGWDLLSSWRTPPGVAEDGQVDEQHLTDWINQVRELANQHDRIIVTDHKIGNVLSYFPRDPVDSAWPHQALRRLLERVASVELELGIEIGNYNSIGVQIRNISEGGVQERERAKEWRKQAEIVGLRWPRTLALLKRIADHWEDEARQQDTRVRQERLRDW